MQKYEYTKNISAPVVGQIPPHDYEVEASVLGAIVSYPNIYEGVKDMLKDDCFYNPTYKVIYGLVVKVAADGNLPSMMNVIAKAASEGMPTEMNVPYEVATLAGKASGNEIKYSIQVLIQLRKERQMQSFWGKIYNGALADPEDALGELQGIINDYKSAKDGEFAELVALPTKQSLDAKFCQTQEAYQTKYMFQKGAVTYPLMIPSGAITFLAAPTSHGKSTLLRCLALDMAKDELSKPEADRGAILYFTFEEDDTDVIAQLMNTYIGKDFTRANRDFSHGNLASLKEYLNKGKSDYIQKDMRNEVASKVDEFERLYLYSGLLRVFYRNYDSTKLIKAIEYMAKHMKVKAVFIDYIQLLQMEGKSNRVSRTEELKAICTDLKDFAVTSKLPIICAAQLNRDGAKSPLDMRPQNMSESSDIEKIANVIVCMYNSDHKVDNASDYDKRAKEANLIARDFLIGDARTKIYAVIAKNRGGIIGGDAVLRFNGNTGEVKPNGENTETNGKSKDFNPAFASFGQHKEQSEIPF